jgi:hypothetical protein
LGFNDPKLGVEHEKLRFSDQNKGFDYGKWWSSVHEVDLTMGNRDLNQQEWSWPWKVVDFATNNEDLTNGNGAWYSATTAKDGGYAMCILDSLMPGWDRLWQVQYQKLNWVPKINRKIIEPGFWLGGIQYLEDGMVHSKLRVSTWWC